jgi:hypothetical protein
MKHLFAAALALSVGLGASGAALAQAPAVQCDVVMQSQAGGMIEVRSGAQAADHLAARRLQPQGGAAGDLSGQFPDGLLRA